MTNFRFLHCADLHLDSPLRGLEADPDAPAGTIRGATRAALRNMVDFAIAERVDFVLAAGDLYDGVWQDWRTGHFLGGQIALLDKAGIPFIAIRGNHDAESVITRRLRMPSQHTRLLDHRRPETVRLPNLRVSIHGQSFATRAVTDNLAITYPPPDPDRFNIGLLHSSVGERVGHDTYASCSVDDLRSHQYDYWALGHIHAREVLSADPWIVFPGNLQGRHVNETGAKGAMLVTVQDGKVAGVPRFVPFDTVRWARIPVVLPADADEDAALTEVRAALTAELDRSEGRLLAARIIVSGICAAHDLFVRDIAAAREKIRAEAVTVAGPGAIWVEKVVISTRAVPVTSAANGRSDAMGRLIRAVAGVPDNDVITDVRAYAVAMLEKANPLRGELGDEHSATGAAKGEIAEDVISRARDLLLASLVE